MIHIYIIFEVTFYSTVTQATPLQQGQQLLVVLHEPKEAAAIARAIKQEVRPDRNANTNEYISKYLYLGNKKFSTRCFIKINYQVLTLTINTFICFTNFTKFVRDSINNYHRLQFLIQSYGDVYHFTVSFSYIHT